MPIYPAFGPAIGDECPKGGLMLYAVYHGQKTELLGKRALLIEKPHPDYPNKVVAQFDEPATGYAHGWWPFNRSEFTLYPQYSWSIERG